MARPATVVLLVLGKFVLNGAADTATTPCRGGHQTSLLASCAELPDHIDRGHTAATHTLLAVPVQGRAPCASVTTASTLRALYSIGCFAWPCQPIDRRSSYRK